MTWRSEDIPARFNRNFFFGCEADDPLVQNAFDRKGLPFGNLVRFYTDTNPRFFEGAVADEGRTHPIPDTTD